MFFHSSPRSAALPFFHSFTPAWETWGVFPEVTREFQSLSQCPEELTEEQLGVVQRFTILMYKRTSNLVKVNEARLQLFTQGQRQIDNMPPTKAALAEHTRRAAYQGGHVWGQTMIPIQELPLPSDWGWRTDGKEWTPLWSTLPEAGRVCEN